MGFITEVVTPIIKVLLLGGFILGWVVAGIYLLMKYVLKKRVRLWIKYHIFRKKYEEDLVAWCLDAYEKGYRDEIDLKKFLLVFFIESFGL